jgi:hypothetical protein
MQVLRPAMLVAAALGALASAGCSDNGLKAPTDVGVCWHLVRVEGEYRFNKLASNQPQLEHCAARLEDMRLNFMRLGSAQSEVVGAYQGQFIFLQREGVFTAKSLNSTPYLALVRTGDGRLAIPGAIKTN